MCQSARNFHHAGHLVLCRLSRGNRPLLVILPPPPALEEQQPVTSSGPYTPVVVPADMSNTYPSDTLAHKNIKPTKGQAGMGDVKAEAAAALPNTPMPGTPVRRAGAAQRVRGVDRLLQQMQLLLSDSSSSMKQDGEEGHSQESKLMWWRVRPIEAILMGCWSLEISFGGRVAGNQHQYRENCKASYMYTQWSKGTSETVS